MKMAFTSLGCPEWLVDEIAAKARDYGYEGVELRTADDGNHLSPDASPDEVESVGKAFSKAGISVISVLGYARFATLDPKDTALQQATLRKHIAIARSLKAPFIRAYAGQIPPGANRDAIAAAIIEGLKPLADEAAAAGVRIGIETHDDWCPGAEVMKIVKGVGSPALGVVYDIFNSFTDGREPWATTWETIRDHVLYCHLKDGYRKPDGGIRYVYLGAGDLPVAAILGRMKKDGYAGYLSFEWEKKWIPKLEPPEETFPHFAHKVRKVWGEV